ncbi:hypothetical protein N657DRAFT_464440 [Parathielavia appendiculata]|uniref:Uncharacterized protein n=1 Tax=Parathielavia appendiculata TaxID=2587402 RepID=A0AAN6U097_9PEZI|nr:hypothetical protein N657DRAFT_464440 [Parathielavia appendiculata]
MSRSELVPGAYQPYSTRSCLLSVLLTFALAFSTLAKPPARAIVKSCKVSSTPGAAEAPSYSAGN